MRRIPLLICTCFIFFSFDLFEEKDLPSGKYILLSIQNQSIEYNDDLPFDTLILDNNNTYSMLKGNKVQEKGTYTISRKSSNEKPPTIKFDKENLLGVSSLSIHPRKFTFKDNELFIFENSCDGPVYNFCGTPKLNEALVKGDSIKNIQFNCHELNKYSLKKL